MIKLKKLIKEHAWDRKFGEPLPTLKDVTEKYQIEEKETINEDDAGDVLHDYIYWQLANTIKDTEKKWKKVTAWGDKNTKQAQDIIKMVVALEKKIKQISR